MGKESMTVREFFRSRGLDILECMPVGYRNCGGITILSFHHIDKEKYHWFKALIGELDKHYDLINADALFYDSSHKKRSQIKLIISFDDGYHSSYELLDYIHKTYHLRCILFACTGFIGLRPDDATNFYHKHMLKSKSANSLEVEAMSWRNVCKLVSQGHLVGAHTHTHPTLANLDRQEIEFEVCLSTKEIIKKTGIRPTCFAYPFGNVSSLSPETIEVVARKFHFAFTNVRGGLIDSPSKYLVYRQNVHVGDSLNRVSAAIVGKFNLLSFLSRMRLRKMARICRVS